MWDRKYEKKLYQGVKIVLSSYKLDLSVMKEPLLPTLHYDVVPKLNDKGFPLAKLLPLKAQGLVNRSKEFPSITSWTRQSQWTFSSAPCPRCDAYSSFYRLPILGVMVSLEFLGGIQLQ